MTDKAAEWPGVQMTSKLPKLDWSKMTAEDKAWHWRQAFHLLDELTDDVIARYQAMTYAHTEECQCGFCKVPACSHGCQCDFCREDEPERTVDQKLAEFARDLAASQESAPKIDPSWLWDIYSRSGNDEPEGLGANAMIDKELAAKMSSEEIGFGEAEAAEAKPLLPSVWLTEEIAMVQQPDLRREYAAHDTPRAEAQEAAVGVQYKVWSDCSPEEQEAIRASVRALAARPGNARNTALAEQVINAPHPRSVWAVPVVHKAGEAAPSPGWYQHATEAHKAAGGALRAGAEVDKATDTSSGIGEFLQEQVSRIKISLKEAADMGIVHVEPWSSAELPEKQVEAESSETFIFDFDQPLVTADPIKAMDASAARKATKDIVTVSVTLRPDPPIPQEMIDYNNAQTAKYEKLVASRGLPAPNVVETPYGRILDDSVERKVEVGPSGYPKVTVASGKPWAVKKGADDMRANDEISQLKTANETMRIQILAWRENAAILEKERDAALAECDRLKFDQDVAAVKEKQLREVFHRSNAANDQLVAILQAQIEELTGVTPPPAPGIPLRALGGTHAATGLKMGERG